MNATDIFLKNSYCKFKQTNIRIRPTNMGDIGYRMGGFITHDASLIPSMFGDKHPQRPASLIGVY